MPLRVVNGVVEAYETTEQVQRRLTLPEINQKIDNLTRLLSEGEWESYITGLRTQAESELALMQTAKNLLTGGK